jgi:hypothetical protein
VSHLRNYVIDDDRTDDCAFGADDAAGAGTCSDFYVFRCALTISGTVASQDGHPIDKLKVNVNLQGVISVGVGPWAYTDETGYFMLANLELGSYSMITEKPAEYYARLPSCFYDSYTPWCYG